MCSQLNEKHHNKKLCFFKSQLCLMYPMDHCGRTQLNYAIKLQIIIIIELQMTSKVKANILYIASDEQSDKEEKVVVTAEISKTQPVPKQYNLAGSHRLSNNVFGQGFFAHKNELDYEYEEGYQHYTNAKTKTVWIQNNSSFKRIRQRKKSSPRQENSLTQESSPNQENSPVQEDCQIEGNPKSESPKQQFSVQNTDDPYEKKLKPNSKRSKTLMFDFNEDDSENDQHMSSPTTPRIPQSQRNISDKKQQSYSKAKQPITPTRIPKRQNRKQYMLSTIPTQFVLECRICKKNEISNLLLSQFDMTFRNYVDYIASCKKIIASIGSNYRLSLDPQNFLSYGDKVLGKVKSSGSKDVYNIYDDGVNKENAKSCDSIREILATVRIRAREGPRSMEVYVLKEGFKYAELVGKTTASEPTLETLYSVEGNQDRIHLFKTRKAAYSAEQKEYYLDFKGRIALGSIRNFILEEPQTGEEVLMFGKSSNNNYNVDISHPLTPMLGLSLVVPMLDRDD